MSIGQDIKSVLQEIGVEYTILRDGGDITGEYGDFEINAQVTKPFIREFFSEVMLAHDTQILPGDVVQANDGRIFIVMNKTPELFENTIYQNNAVFYKANVKGTIFRQSNGRDGNYVMQAVWAAQKQDCHALLTESFFGNELELEEPIGRLAREAQDLYIPNSFGLNVNDRFDVSQVQFISKISAAGTTDSNKGIVSAGATVSETWSVVFSSATEFSVAGLEEGSVGSGQVDSEFNGYPYFVIPTNFFTGTWSPGDTYVFRTEGEYYQVTEIKTRRFTGVDLAQLEEDTR